MKKLVSSETIKDLTIDAAIGDNYSSNPPTVESIKQHIIEQASKNRLSGGEYQRLRDKRRHERLTEVEYARYAGHKKYLKIKKALGTIPRDFDLALVLYSRITYEQNKAVYKEFSRRVKPRFYKHLAENYVNELKELGLCEHAIIRMKQGMDPADHAGRLYDVNVDHVIERAGSGKCGTERARDPYMPGETNPTFRVNHFNNLVLLTRNLHDNVKNLINDTQNLSEIKKGQSKWGVMVVPKRNEKTPSFIYVPSKYDNDEYKLQYRSETTQDLVYHADYVLAQTRSTVKEFMDRASVRKAVEIIEDLSIEENEDLETLLENQETDPVEKKTRKLSDVFNAAIQKDKVAVDLYNNRVLPLFRDMAYHFDKARLEVDDLDKGDKNKRLFIEICKSHKLHKLKEDAVLIPVQGEGSALNVIGHIRALHGTSKYSDKKRYKKQKHHQHDSHDTPERRAHKKPKKHHHKSMQHKK